jgi:hypothetical protein
MVPIDPIGITAAEFEILKDFTIRHKNDANAIFSTNERRKLWPTTRNGKNPESERLYIDGCFYILDQLAKSYRMRREEGGRLFVDLKGAYQKTGEAWKTEKEYFVEWRWKGEPPPKREMRSTTLPERLAERRAKEESA